VIRGVWLMALVVLAGCSSTPPIIAAVTGGVAGGATANPAIGFAVAVATDAAASEIVRYYGRSRQNSEQNAIADVAGELPIGTEATWRIEHTIPIGDKHGVLHVVRQIDNPLAVCREIVFSVDEGKDTTLRRAWYDADICHQADRWKWASAEPAVARWGYLQ
jgi:hypothetical protein